MEVVLAKSYGFCFGVKRAIKIAEENINSVTLGPLIHNKKEIERLKRDYGVRVVENIDEAKKSDSIIIRTHGIPKNDLKDLKEANKRIIDATCPFVTKPQKICEQMSKEGYDIVIFGDENHPEVKGVKSYAVGNVVVTLDIKKLESTKFSDKIALISQTTRKLNDFLEIANYLITRYSEVRVFNTICNATFDNQEATKELAKSVDIVIVIGSKDSSNTKQLLNISKECNKDSYLVEDESDLLVDWFMGKKVCGVTAGASTPDWIINSVIEKIRGYEVK